MRKIEWTTAFKRDRKREKRGPHGQQLDDLIDGVATPLANDQALPEARRDHPLTGPWEGHRDCHLRPDLLLIYRKPDKHTLQLVRLGTHHELFGT
jgi:mRNA interferase YafQ